LVDRAETMVIAETDAKMYEQLDQFGDPNVTGATALFLRRGYLGVRYELDAAHVMMLQLALGLAGHPETPEAFEKVAADFIAVAMELSRSDVRMNFDFFKIRPPWREVLSNGTTAPMLMPNGWTAPLMLAEKLRRSTPTDMIGGHPNDPRQDDVDRIISTKKLAPEPAISTATAEPKSGETKKMQRSEDVTYDDDDDDPLFREPSPTRVHGIHGVLWGVVRRSEGYRDNDAARVRVH
jgi:hypothetical protein